MAESRPEERRLASPAVWMLALPLVAAQSAQLSGVVRAPDGAPAAGARVVLATPPEYFESFAAVLDETVADPEGRFALAIPESWMRKGKWGHELWAWREGAGLVFSTWRVEDVPIGEALSLRLPPQQPTEFTVLDSAGAPVAGARVSLNTYDNYLVPAVIADALAARTDERGVVRLPWCDPKRLTGLTIDAGEKLGRQTLRGEAGWFGAEPLRLRPTGTVQVEIAGQAPSELARQELRIWSFFRDPLQDHRAPSVQGEVRVPIASAASGRSVPIMVGGGTFDLRLEAAPSVLPAIGPLKVEAGQTATVKVEWKRGVPVAGRIEDESGTAVANVEVRVLAYPARFRVRSDSEGRLAFHALPGPLVIEGVEAPEGLASSMSPFEPLRSEVPADAGRFDLPPIRLARAASVRGRVVDAGGRAVAGAWIHGSQRHPLAPGDRRQVTTSLCTLSGEDGSFEFPGLLSGSMLEIGARFAARTTPELRGCQAGQADPVELVLGGESLAVAGTVRDGAGKAVSGAAVVLWRASPENMIGGEREVLVGGQKSLTTGADGTFAGPPSLEPDERYCALVRAGGFAPLESAWFKGSAAAAGLSFELSALATLEGRLLDEDRRPLAGARVFVSGDAPAPVEARTSSDGRFALNGVFAGGGFLLAEHPQRGLLARGYSGTAPIEWSLASGDRGETRPPSASARGQELGLAARLLAAEVQRARETKDDSQILRALERLAWVDPGQVLETIEREPIATDWMNDFARSAVVSALCARDPDEAVAEAIGDAWHSALASLQVVDALGPGQRERKLELLGAIRAGVRAVENPPYRLALLAHVAEHLLDLGERDAARGILDEGLELARTLPAEEWSGYARGRFAEELAQVDLEPALELVKGIGEDEGRHLGNIAHELAAIDPMAAERLLASLTPSGAWDQERYAPRVCYRMALADSARARSIADRSPVAAQCYGTMALALAEREPATARELLREAFERLALLRAFWTGGAHDPVVLAASLLPVAERIAPDELDSYIARALSLREPRARLAEYPGAIVPYLQADAGLAFHLARHDRELARRLTEPAVEYLLENRDVGRDWDWNGLYAALAVIDPERASALAEQGLPAAARSVIGAVLARAGEERLRYVQEECLRLWVADKEDL